MAEYTEGVRVYHSAEQSIPQDTDTVLAFDSTRWDTDEIHDPVTNNSRLTCKTAGKYFIAGVAYFKQALLTGDRRIMIKLNGINTIIDVSWGRNDDGPTRMNCGTIWSMGIGDYVEVVLYQGSTGSIDIYGEENNWAEFMMQRIG